MQPIIPLPADFWRVLAVNGWRLTAVNMTATTVIQTSNGGTVRVTRRRLMTIRRVGDGS